MSNYISKYNWDKDVFQKLNNLIHLYRTTDSTLQFDKEYVVFDFDDTTSFKNTLINTTVYAINELAFKMKPSQFRKILRSVSPNKNQTLIKDRPEVTLENLVDDIIDNYSWLYKNYIINPVKNDFLLNKVHNTKQFKEFRAKYWFYYKNRKQMGVTRKKGQIWSSYWFDGYEQEELINLSKKALFEMEKLPYDTYTFQGTGYGKTGYIEATFDSGLSFPIETLELYDTLQKENIDVFVVSASPYEIIVAAVEKFGYNVPRSQIIGMSTLQNNDGKMQSILDPNSIITKNEGKFTAIKKKIMPLYNKEPIAVFGDSYGDYHMMTEFKDTKLKVLFNRYHNDETKSIVKKIITDKNKNSFVIQGRDENTGKLRPSPKTVPFGYDKEVLTFDEL